MFCMDLSSVKHFAVIINIVGDSYISRRRPQVAEVIFSIKLKI